jgi:zinc transporter
VETEPGSVPAALHDGLWLALLLDGAGHARSLDWSAAATWTEEQGALWIHLDPSSPQAVAWMRTSSGLSGAQVDELLVTDRQPRLKEVGNDRLVASLSGFSPELDIGLS